METKFISPLTGKEETYLYSLFESSTKFEYDTRIDEYNFVAQFFAWMAFYFILQALFRKYAPEPGPYKVYKEKKKLVEYHTYYFQMTTMVHALIGIATDPIAVYYGGYRFNQPKHLVHQFIMIHAFAYFVFDSIAEVYYGTDDLLTNVHHVAVIFASYFQVNSYYCGVEFALIHLMAELSNPFLIIRTVLKIKGMKGTKIYLVNDIIFAVIFIVMRVFVTPVALIFFLESYNCPYVPKLGMIFVLFVQLFWAYRILYLATDALKGALETKEKVAPSWVLSMHRMFFLLQGDKTVKIYVSIFNFMWIFVLPHWYYGYVRGTLFNF